MPPNDRFSATGLSNVVLLEVERKKERKKASEETLKTLAVGFNL